MLSRKQASDSRPSELAELECVAADNKTVRDQRSSTVDLVNELASEYKTCELTTIYMMTEQQQMSVQVDWDTLRWATNELKVPVSLFVLCKTIVEDEVGSLFLNATVVQRVLVGNVPTSGESTAEQLKAVMFGIDLKSPFPGGEVKRRRDAFLTEVGAPPSSTQLCAQTFDLVSVPIDVRSIWHR